MDRWQRRGLFATVVHGLAGLTFARGYALLLASGFVFGFFLLSAGPIGFQYGAEVVITSYSIHYTKLYEVAVLPTPP